MSRDPVGYAEAAGIYQYVVASPINLLDPSGLKKHRFYDDRFDDALEKVGLDIPGQRPYVELDIETDGCIMQIQESVTGGAAGFEVGSAIQFGKFGFGGISAAQFDFVVKYGIPKMEDCPDECGSCCKKGPPNAPNEEVPTKRQVVSFRVEAHHNVTVEKIFGSSKKFSLWVRHLLASGEYRTPCDCNCVDDLEWDLKPLPPVPKSCKESLLITSPGPLPLDPPDSGSDFEQG